MGSFPFAAVASNAKFIFELFPFVAISDVADVAFRLLTFCSFSRTLPCFE